MKKTLSLLISLVILQTGIPAQVKVPLKKMMELPMSRTADDDKPGTRGASVAWHPVLRKYYAGFAGNAEYPLAVFDEKGKRLSKDDLSTMADIRGLWYNPVSKTINGNSYAEGGWFSYKLDKAGVPVDIAVLHEGMTQPTDQSVGVYNPLTKQALFLLNSQVYMYDSKGVLQDSVTIHWERRKVDGISDDEDIEYFNEDYNSNALVYTGIKGQELGFLNIITRQIGLYDIKTGFLVKTLILPDEAITESIFNFAYANGIYWLFDMEERKWIGYK